jgi:hypothetical protein
MFVNDLFNYKYIQMQIKMRIIKKFAINLVLILIHKLYINYVLLDNQLFQITENQINLIILIQLVIILHKYNFFLYIILYNN